MEKWRRCAILCGLVLTLPSGLAADPEESFPTTLVYPSFRHTWGIFRATESLVGLFLGSRGKIDDPQGVAAVRLMESDDPNQDSDNDEITVYGVNSGAGDLLYNPSMSGVSAFGSVEDPRAAFLHPHGVAADEEGNVFVADTGHGRVVRLLHRAGKMTFVGEFGPPSLAAPFGVALDRAGMVYTSDPGRNRIVVTTFGGKAIGAPLEAPGPTGVAVSDSADRWSFFKESAVYAVCRDGSEIWRFDGRGSVVARARAADLPGPPGWRFGYLAIDYCGNVYATDPVRDGIHKFDRNLNYLVNFGGIGDWDAQFRSPRGIAIHRRLGQVFVVEREGAQYYWVGADLRSLDARIDPARRELVVALFPTERAFVRMGIYRKGGLIRALVNRWTAEPGPNRVIWDLKDDAGRPVAAGSYVLRAEIEPTYSSYTHFKKKFERTVEVR